MTSVIELLRTPKADWTKFSSQAAQNFAARLFELYGQRFSKSIRQKLGKIQSVFDQMHRSFFEIQQRLKEGHTGYTELDCPETCKIITAYRLESGSDLAFFDSLKEMSYGVLSFPQSAIIAFKNPELGTLKKIGAVKVKAFFQLMLHLAIEEIEEEKGGTLSSPPPQMRTPTLEEELGLTKLYFGEGAVIYDKRTVYFSEMIRMWGNFSSLNASKHKRLIEHLTTCAWAEETEKPVEAFFKYNQAGVSFQRFLAFCSVESIEKNCQSVFHSKVSEALVDKFMDREQTRSDVCYLSAFPNIFYQLDTSKMERNSASLIRSFQLNTYITSNFGVNDGTQNGLMLILLHMNASWDEKSLPGFKERHWNVNLASPVEIEEFSGVWKNFQVLVKAAANRDVSFADPSQEDVKFFQNPECWNLLFTLWKHPHQGELSKIVKAILHLPKASMTLEAIASICKPRICQLYNYLKRNFKLEDDQSGLLLILAYMDPRWDEKSMPDYSEQCWQGDPLEPYEIATFSEAWNGFRRLVSASAKKEVSFSNPDQEDVKHLKNSDCWNLIVLLWKNPYRKFMLHTIETLSLLPLFSMTVSSIHSFCKENLSTLRPDTMAHFPENYQKVVAEIEAAGAKINETHLIFFDPPVGLSQLAIQMKDAPLNAKEFASRLAWYNFPRNKDYYLMLRQYLLDPNPTLFLLLRDIEAIGGKSTEALLSDVLSKSQEPFGPEPVLTTETRERAIAITAQLQKDYRFNEVQIFSIYLEVIRLVIKKKEVDLMAVSALVHRLVAVCPSVQKKDIYYLFRYHPPIVSEQLTAIVKMRENWVRNEAQLRRFVIDQGVYNGIVDEVEKFVLPMLNACDDLAIKHEFDRTFQYTILSGFFTPFQPLMDQLRITNITETGAKWGEPIWGTHMGQLKFVLEDAKVGIYLNWSILKDRPVLFMMFYDLQKGVAFSSFHSIGVSYKEIASEAKRKVFYNLLLAMGSLVLKEKADINLPMDVPETPDAWASAYIGVREMLMNYRDEFENGNLKPEYVEAMWEFFRKVKLSYRNLYLSSIADRGTPEFESYETKNIAALGHIFPSHPRGSLLPKSQLEPHPEHYIPDASEEFVKACRGLFREATDRQQSLNLELNMPSGKYPISYFVQTADQLTGQVKERSVRNSVALSAELVQGRFVFLSAKGMSVPLKYPPEALEDPRIFQRYFDLHNLLLKMAVFNA